MALPNKTFWCNYNARNYDPNTLTLPKENGQLFDRDLVFPAAVTYNDDHITITDNKRIDISFNSTSNNIFNRTTATATMTFIAKLAGTDDTWFVSNRYYGTVGWMIKGGTFTEMAYTGDNNSYNFQQTNPKIFTWRCGNGTQQYICQTDNVIGTPYQTTDWVGRETTAMHFFGGGDGAERWTGDFYWVYISPETLTDAEIQAVIDYNENTQTPLVQIPVNKYKLGANNISKTYEGSTQINKMYVGNDLVYRALPTTIAPTTPTNVDYVHTSTPTSTANYISTGIYPTTDTVFRIVYKPNATIGATLVGFDYSYNGDAKTPTYASSDLTDYRYMFYSAINNPAFDFNSSRFLTTITFDADGYADITVGNNYITDNIAQSTTTGTTQSSVSTQNVPIYLNVSSDLDFRSLEIWQNNVKVYDGHAAVLNGEYGVYDSVGDTFTTETYGGNSMTGGNI